MFVVIAIENQFLQYPHNILLLRNDSLNMVSASNSEPA